MNEATEVLQPTVVDTLHRLGMTYEPFACDPSLADTAQFCEHYKFSLNDSANCIIVAGKADPIRFACCILLATTKLDTNKTVCKLLNTKRASFATQEQTIELTGMQIGGVTPFGLPEIPVYIDEAVMGRNRVILGGGNRSSKVLMAPAELLKIPGASVINSLAIPK